MEIIQPLRDGLAGGTVAPLTMPTASRVEPEPTELSSAAQRAELTALTLIASNHALVKTVKDGDWLRLMQRFVQPPFRTSFSLLPPSGRMHLFGSVSSQVVGLLFDRAQLERGGSAAGCDSRGGGEGLASDAVLAWPSGYFAKTENNMEMTADGRVTLTGGRWQRLVSLDSIVEANLRADAEHARDPGSEPLLYNEVSLRVDAIFGLSAVFVRTDSPDDALFAMGVRALVQHLFPSLPPLPLLRISSGSGAALISREAQLALLRGQAVGPDATACDGAAPKRRERVRSGDVRLPLDTGSFPELDASERLTLHAAHGISRHSLHDALAEFGGAALLAPHVARSLTAAVSTDNVASAREIVRTAAPLLLRELLIRNEDNGGGATRVTMAAAAAAVASLPRSLSGAEGDAAEEAAAEAAAAALGVEVAAALASVTESVSVLKSACSLECSQGMLVALGAQITISEFVAGKTTRRLENACRWLEDWIWNANQGPCSVVFRLSSWHEARKVDGNSDWYSFLSGKAVANRSAFLQQLESLLRAEENGDGLAFITQLYAISSRLRRPCLRLRILQQVLGLDTRFSRDVVHGVVCFALDILEDMSGGPQKTAARTDIPQSRAAAPAGHPAIPPPRHPAIPPPRHPAIPLRPSAAGAPLPPPECGPSAPLLRNSSFDKLGGEGGAAALPVVEDHPYPVVGDHPYPVMEGELPGLDAYDEATRMDADALFGTGRRERPSDPIGEESRRARVQYYYR